jgi:hypothetical protein
MRKIEGSAAVFAVDLHDQLHPEKSCTYVLELTHLIEDESSEQLRVVLLLPPRNRPPLFAPMPVSFSSYRTIPHARIERGDLVMANFTSGVVGRELAHRQTHHSLLTTHHLSFSLGPHPFLRLS